MDCAVSQRSFRRFNAIHLFYLGASVELVLKNARVSTRTLRFWIQQFNQSGIDGLICKQPPGRKPKLSEEIFHDEVIPLLEEPSKADQTHWTAVKLHGYLQEQNKVDVSYRTFLRYLHNHHYKRLFPQPVPAPPDGAQWKQKRESFIEQIKPILADQNNDVWFCDESGFEADPRPRQRWALRGSRPKVPYHGGHLRRNVIGAVNCQNGQLSVLIVSHCNTEVFQAFLDVFAKEHPPETQRNLYLIMDNASWHKSKTLKWHHIKPLYLPPYSPDFNPIENLWLELKRNHMADFVTKDPELLTQKICSAICTLFDDPKKTKSICSFRK